MELDSLEESGAGDDEQFLAELNSKYIENVIEGIDAALKKPIFAGGLQ